jgi:hypothetical protein
VSGFSRTGRLRPDRVRLKADTTYSFPGGHHDPRIALAAFVALLWPIAAGAAEIKVLSTQAVEGAYRELVPQFEKASGHKVTTVFTGTLDAQKRIAAGEQYDLIIMAGPAIDDLIKSGKVATGSRVDLASSGIGLAVRAGAPKPDIRTTDALKKDIAGGEIDRLLHRPERCVSHRPVPQTRHRRPDQAEAETDSDRRVRRQHSGQRGGRNRVSAGQ